MDNKALALASRLLLQWADTHYRPLPWRENPTPYGVWISEIMLQQTRIEAVIPYYRRFMEHLPTVEHLANVSSEELMKLWEGLGYYSRARNLQKTAQILCRDYGGELPGDYDALLSLPGIGEYTAGAIASLSFGIPVPAVDGNVMRVLSRLTGDGTDVLSGSAKAHFGEIVRTMMPSNRAGAFNQALMELGETVCLPHAIPCCGECPFKDLCQAHAMDLTAQLPVRIKKTKRRLEHRTVGLFITEEIPRRVLLHKRDSHGLLADLWEFPNVLCGQEASLLPAEMMAHAVKQDSLPHGKHLFSHVEWRLAGERYSFCPCPMPEDYRLVTLEELSEAVAVPSAFRTYTALLPELL